MGQYSYFLPVILCYSTTVCTAAAFYCTCNERTAGTRTHSVNLVVTLHPHKRTGVQQCGRATRHSRSKNQGT